MKRPWILLLGGVMLVVGLAAGSAGEREWPWGDELDAVAAAPGSHRVLLDNDVLRVLDVTIEPGDREPPHTHAWPSVMMVIERARIRYYGADGKLRFESPPRAGEGPAELGADWLRPEGLHAVENVDDRRFRALRVELKPRAE